MRILNFVLVFPKEIGKKKSQEIHELEFSKMLVWQRTPEKPCLNDVTGVGTWRKSLLSVTIFLVVLTLLPVWDELAEELGIGLVTTF